MAIGFRRSRLRAVMLTCVLVLAGAGAARAQVEKPRLVTNPPLLELKRKPVTGSIARTASLAQEASHEESVELDIEYVTGTMYNPALGLDEPVTLRAYKGTRMDPENPFISPELDVKPGDTVRISLNNKLPADSSCTTAPKNMNVPHCFNGTNLHAHGLWVNPAGNSDNVLISINPGVSFQYEYNIPSDHPAGTFWYHTHRHGSTALQVASGMAGALIIRGDRRPTATSTGDIDTLLRPTAAQKFKERVVVLQQIQYACRDAKKNIKYVDGDPKKPYRCDKGDVGTIEGYDQLGSTWKGSGRYTSINGKVLPTFSPDAVAGQIERWRVIHGGVRDTIDLQFRKFNAGTHGTLQMPVAEQDVFVDNNCTGAPLPQHLIAADGLTLGAVIRTEQTIYQPAYRWDLLMVFPEPGDYCVIDAASPAPGSVNQAAPSRQLLGVVHVGAGRAVRADLTAYLTDELAKAAQVNLPAVQTKVVADLRNGLRLSSFVPHPDIKETELTDNGQKLTFTANFTVDGQSFDPSHLRQLRLGGVEQWTIQSVSGSHPFHIHVNPFQIVEIRDPDGKDVSAPGAVDDASGSVDPQYPGLKGVWKDTLWVKNIGTDTNPRPYKIVVRTRYERYIGDFVLHCHILDHEDKGMMQLVRVALPDGAGGMVSGHEH